MSDDALNNHLDYLDQLDVDIARDEEDFNREKCALCGCRLPVDGLPCECEDEEIPF